MFVVAFTCGFRLLILHFYFFEDDSSLPASWLCLLFSFYLILFLLISVLECPFTFLSNRKQISYLQNVMLIYPFIEEEFQVHSFLYYHSWSGFKSIMRSWLLVNLLFYRWEALLVLIGWHPVVFFFLSKCHLKHITFSRFMFLFCFASNSGICSAVYMFVAGWHFGFIFIMKMQFSKLMAVGIKSVL